MKTKILFVSFLLCLIFQANAQGLIVTYEESNPGRAPADLSQIPDPQLRAMIQRQLREANAPRVSQLIVNDGISRFQAQETDRGSRDAGVITTVRRMGIHTIYKNHSDNLLIARANLGGRTDYFVEKYRTALEWTIGTERREISGFQTINATTQMPNGHSVIAWFTPDIPISDGPYLFWGLPGLILYVDVDNGRRIFSATAVQHTNDLAEIQIPDGERISNAEFEELSRESMQRLREGGEGEGVVIRTTTM